MYQELSLYFEKHKNAGLFISYLLIVFIGFLDYITGYKLGFSIFYLIPIVLVVWFSGMLPGLIISLMGTIVWVLADAAARDDSPELFIMVWNAFVRMGFFTIVTIVLAKLRLSLEREKTLARTDFLTGIANNQAFMEILNQESQRALRSKQPLTLVFFDCDHFKSINDNFGHETGNKLLKEVSLTIQMSIRSIDTAGRLGGDEFLVLLPETGAEDAKIVVYRMQQNLLKLMYQNNWNVTFSIGVATFTIPLKTGGEMISQADQLMYAAKKEGKNRIVHQIFSERTFS